MIVSDGASPVEAWRRTLRPGLTVTLHRGSHNSDSKPVPTHISLPSLSIGPSTPPPPRTPFLSCISSPPSPPLTRLTPSRLNSLESRHYLDTVSSHEPSSHLTLASPLPPLSSSLSSLTLLSFSLPFPPLAPPSLHPSPHSSRLTVLSLP